MTAGDSAPYPVEARRRNRWVVQTRPRLPRPDPRQPIPWLIEEERIGPGHSCTFATLFPVNRECPWHCVMCDLWRHATATPTPPATLPGQIERALDEVRRQYPDSSIPGIKIYNSGSFFDTKAVPSGDWAAIARLLLPFQHIVIESHPALIGDPLRRWMDHLAQNRPRPPTVEVAMGLETADPTTLEKLNKGVSLAKFADAAATIKHHNARLRTFILVQPPFQPPRFAVHWAVESVRFASDLGSDSTVLIPTRGGNGALETLAAHGEFHPPDLATLETAFDASLNHAHGVLLADLWNLERLGSCVQCFPARLARLQLMNASQRPTPRIDCPQCTPPRSAP